MDSKINKDFYENIRQVPALSSAKFSNGSKQVILKTCWTNVDYVQKTPIKFNKDYILSNDLSLIASLESNIDTKSYAAPGENGNKLLWDVTKDNIRCTCYEYKPVPTVNNSDEAVKQSAPNAGCFVQIWESSKLIKSVKITCPESFGEDMKDVSVKVLPYDPLGACPFGSVSISPDKKKILFVMETPKKLLKDVRHPTIAVMDLESTKIEVVPQDYVIQNKLACGQAIWCPQSKGIVFVGHLLTPFKLGLTYCQQRPSRIYHWNFDDAGSVCALSSANHSVRTPRFSPDGSLLVWLDMFIGGTHLQCQRLVCSEWPVQQNTCCVSTDSSNVLEIVPLFDYPQEDTNNFPGIYNARGLTPNCWSSDGAVVYFSTNWSFSVVVVGVDVRAAVETVKANVQSLAKTKRKCPLICPAPLGTGFPGITQGGQAGEKAVHQEVTIMDVRGDLLVARVSCVDVPPVIGLLKLPSPTTHTQQAYDQLKWKLLSLDAEPGEGEGQCERLSNVDCVVLNHVATQADAYGLNVLDFQSLLMMPTGTNVQLPSYPSGDGNFARGSATVRGLILVIHGGPHSVYVNCWMPLIATFLAHGFACLAVNYRGSIGYGDASIHSLPGSIGDMDVKDCVQATEEALSHLKSPDMPCFLLGGSHGGFLTCHLAAQHPRKYSAAAALNPVTDLPAMASQSDIADWAFVEARVEQLEEAQPDDHLRPGLPLTLPPRGQCWYMGQLGASTQEELSRLAQCSPLRHVNDKWATPIALFLGANDLRVPNTQGITFYKKVKACTLNSGVHCEAYMYPNEGHALLGLETTRDMYSRILTLFTEHLGSS